MSFSRLTRFSALPVLVLLLLVTACSSTSSSSASASASDSSATSASPDASAEESIVSAFDLEVGDCFNTDDVSTVNEVTATACDASHVYEVFGLSNYDAAEDADFPGDDALSTAAEDACRPAFEDYVGVAYDDSEWYGTFINPSEETWANGDREIVCVLHTKDETEVTGSAEGSEG
ncbi:MAG: septum formation family protein [Chloroflexota bacterium]